VYLVIAVSNKNRWRRDNSFNNKMNWLECKHELLNYYLESQIKKDAQGYIVNDKYLVSPHKKWKQVGKSQWYFYKNIEDLVTRYLKKGKNYEDNKSVQSSQAV
jgi:hypothetical protein